MERLSFTSKTNYNATEAAIHMARYQLAAPHAKGRRVLDVACGEGYGAFALKLFGAKRVEAVDISPEAINVARSLFATEGVTYHVHDAEHLDELFSRRTFDVIVSLETIEHLQDPERFLKAIKRVAKHDAVIVMSCPNDHWYYKDDNQSNPFHVRKYSFEEFRELTTSVLGRQVVWGYGVPIVGFGNIREDLSASRDPIPAQTAMLDFRRQASAVALPPRAFGSVGPRNCSYFVGIWGGDEKNVYTAAFAPISMDEFSNLVSWDASTLSPARIDVLEQENAVLRSTCQSLEASLADIRERHQVELGKVQLAEAKHDEVTGLAEARYQLITQLSEQVGSLERDVMRANTLRQDLEGELADITERWSSSASDERVMADKISTLGKASQHIEALLDVVTKERESHRIQLLALAKELDLSNRRIGDLVSERDRLLTDLEAYRASEAATRQEIAVQRRDLQELRPRLDEIEKERESHRIQVVALAKELDLSNRRIGDLASERDRLLADLEACRTSETAMRPEIAEQTKELGETRSQLDQIEIGRERRIVEAATVNGAEHSPPIDPLTHSETANPLLGMRTAQATDESLRIQALALSKELNIASARIDRLMRERESLLADPTSRTAKLLNERQALEQQLNAEMRVSERSAQRLRERLPDAAKSGLLRMARRMRPYLPPPLLSAAQAVARSLRM